jgi:hypothetical protein
MSQQNKMRILLRLLVGLGMAGTPLTLPAQEAAPTNEVAKVSEAINVVIHKPVTGEERPARVNDQIKDDEVLRTGERSMAEMEFQDKTVTRIGSKSVFTFDGRPRKYKVKSGIAVICVPKATGDEKGKKRGEINSSALTAAIEGTTVLVQEMELPPLKPGGEPRHASRMIFIEGNGTVTTPDGKKSRKIKAGQMIVKFEDDPDLPQPVDVDVAALLQGSTLLNGFSRDLPSTGLIAEVIQQQQTEIAQGVLSTYDGTGRKGSAPQDPSFVNAARGTQSLSCEFVGNGFYLCFQPCTDCTVCEPVPDGGFVCRKD